MTIFIQFSTILSQFLTILSLFLTFLSQFSTSYSEPSFTVSFKLTCSSSVGRCGNPSGRRSFNSARVRHHFFKTMYKLRCSESPSRDSPGSPSTSEVKFNLFLFFACLSNPRIVDCRKEQEIQRQAWLGRGQDQLLSTSPRMSLMYQAVRDIENRRSI